MKKRYTDERFVRILQEDERWGSTDQGSVQAPQCRGVDVLSLAQFGRMDVAKARRRKELESENERLKRPVAEQLLVIDGLKEFNRKINSPTGRREALTRRGFSHRKRCQR